MVPYLAQCRFSIRSPRRKHRDELVEKVKNCARGAALAMGCEVKFGHFGRVYEAMRINPPIENAFLKNIASLGLEVNRVPEQGMGSTDAANVGQVVPMLHGYVAIAAEGTKPHTVEFAKAASSDEGMRAMIKAAKALAMTAVDVFCSEELLAQIREEFAQAKGGDNI